MDVTLDTRLARVEADIATCKRIIGNMLLRLDKIMPRKDYVVVAEEHEIEGQMRRNGDVVQLEEGSPDTRKLLDDGKIRVVDD